MKTAEQEPKVKPVKVDRECPRCNVRAYHWGNDMGVPHRIRCARCGHCWTGRILKEECANLYMEGWEPPLDGNPQSAPGVVEVPRVEPAPNAVLGRDGTVRVEVATPLPTHPQQEKPRAD